MQDNPYMAMLNSINQQAQAGMFPPVRTGVVVGVAPLAVNTGGITLSGADLLVNADVLPRTRTVKLTEPIGTIKGDATGAANGVLTVDLQEAEAIFTETEQDGTLAVGNRVVLLTEDNNVFVVMCKVVGA